MKRVVIGQNGVQVSRRVAFYRWICHSFSHLFPNLLERTRLFRALKKQQVHLWRFLAEPSMLELIDSCGIERLHPRRQGRRRRQIGRKGCSNRCWIVEASCAFWSIIWAWS